MCKYCHEHLFFSVGKAKEKNVPVGRFFFCLAKTEGDDFKNENNKMEKSDCSLRSEFSVFGRICRYTC